MRSKKRAYVETYGCQMNIADGELMEGVLEGEGYEIVGAPEHADVVLVNTCAIREHAERRVLGRVAQLNALKRERPDMILGVTGCMAQRMGDDLLRKAPWVDLVMGPDGYRGLPTQLRRIEDGTGDGEAGASRSTRAVARPEGRDGDGGRASAGPPPAEVFPGQSRAAATGRTVIERDGVGDGRIQLAVVDLDTGENYEGLEQRRTSGVSAWIPVQRGCDHRCTFCIVPYVRGPEKNRRPGDVLDEVAALAGRGITEVTLLGQTVNSYRSGEWGFPRLLREVGRVPGIRRVRFTSPHPNDVTEELVDVMATEPAVCEQLHLPVQSGSDRVLKRMVRRYTVESFLEKVALVRQAVPDVALSTDVIVGFPSETDAEFRDTLDLMRTVRFDDAFTYKYSRREGTPATRMPEGWFLPDDVAQARLEELIDVARSVQAEINASEVGRVERVLVEKEGRDPGEVLGRTRRNKVVVFPGDPSWIGSYRTVRLTRTTGATFGGELVRAPAALAGSA
ncbi:MAG: MiaB/RimO family radical SAM methylthiotransferase [Gemmatimonadota bacterium]